MSRLQSLREALSHAPDNTALLLLYGHACLDELLLDEAQEIFSQILVSEPEHPEAQLCLARTLVLQGDTSGAAVRAERILQRDATNASAHLLLSRIHLTENQRGKAIEHYHRAQEIDPTATDSALEADLGRIKAAPPRERITSPLDLLEDDDGPDIPQEFFEDPFDEPINSEWRPETFFAPGDTERFRVNFGDVGGMDALKEEIKLKIIYPLQHPELYKAYGRKTGGGILLYGPPGCGKTLLLRATAGEVSCNYFAIGLHEVFDPYYGSIERNLHQIFETARANTPCVLVPPPDVAARLQIIKLLAKDKPIARLDDAVLAQATEGFTGADMRWVFERAAELALADALHAGKTVPIHMDLLLAIIRSHTPSTQDWMDGVQQHLPATSHDAISTEVRKFLQATPKKS